MSKQKYKRLSEVSDWYRKQPWTYPKGLDTLVVCIHCGRVFKLAEAQMDFSDRTIICKYAPECDGTLIDFVDVDKRAKMEGVSVEEEIERLKEYFNPDTSG